MRRNSTMTLALRGNRMPTDNWRRLTELHDEVLCLAHKELNTLNMRVSEVSRENRQLQHKVSVLTAIAVISMFALAACMWQLTT